MGFLVCDIFPNEDQASLWPLTHDKYKMYTSWEPQKYILAHLLWWTDKYLMLSYFSGMYIFM